MNETMKRTLDMFRTSCGADICQWLYEDDNVIEIMLNPDGKLWLDILGAGMKDTGCILDQSSARRIINIAASFMETECNSDNPIISAELPGTGERFEGLIPPVVTSPVFSIRKKAIKIFSLDDYVKQNIMTEKQKELIIKAVKEAQNILIVGGTGTGKTTLANAILDKISKTGSRVVILEDTAELQCNAPNYLNLRARSEENQSMQSLLKSTMRLRPDRIIVGEVRDKAALDLLKAWNTGHPGGIATVHANSALDGLYRLEQLIAEASSSPQRQLIAQAINIIIFIKRFGTGRKIEQIAKMKSLENNDYHLEYIV